MGVEKDKIEELLRQLPEELQGEVLRFAEALLRKKQEGSGFTAAENGSASVRSFFGIWDSGNPRSADNDLIDADLACEYASPHDSDPQCL
jgi:hypothetical protein